MNTRRRLLERLVVAPGQAAGLAARDPGWTGGDEFPDLAAEELAQRARDAITAGVADLSEAQELLWASDRYALLVVLQAMNAAGKDSVINHVMSRHENVAGRVYIAAFAPDAGESVNTLIAGFPAGGPQPPILPPVEGFLFLDRDKFASSFAADLPAADAAFMADSQVPWGVEALNGTITEPAWRIKPSWYLVATDDRMIPPPAQRTMSERTGATVVEAAGSHSIYVSQAHATAELIKRPAHGALAETREAIG